jgi:hypothetical protein
VKKQELSAPTRFRCAGDEFLLFPQIP